MTRTKADIRAEVERLGLPSVVRDILDGKVPHPALTDVCRAPESILASWPSCRPDVVPLWESQTQVTAFDPQPREFIRFSLEAPEDEVMRVSSFQAVGARVIISLWENEEEEEAMRAVAHLFEFERLDDFFEGIEEANVQSRDDYDALIARFLVSLE